MTRLGETPTRGSSTPEAQGFGRRRVLALLGLAGLSALAGDQILGHFEAGPLPPAEARRLLNPGSTTLVHIFGGLATPAAATELIPGLPITMGVQKASAIVYGYAGIRVAETLDLAMRAQGAMRPERTIIIGQSAGYMMAVDLAKRIKEAGGQTDVLLADSGCSGPNSVRKGFNFARGLNSASFGQPVTTSATANRLKPGIVASSFVPPTDQRQAALVTPEQFEGYKHHISQTPLWLIGLQLEFLANWQPPSAEGLAATAMYFGTYRPDLDSFINPDIGYAEIQGWFGKQPVARVYDATRHPTSHTATGYPGSIVEIVGNVANA